MLTLTTMIRKLLAPMLATLLLIGIVPPKTQYSVKDEQTCLTNFTVISDVHMEGNNKAKQDAFALGLYDIKNNTSGNDALIFLGDSTMNGQNIENLLLYGYLNRIQPADRIYMTLGNHDTGNGINNYDKLVNRFYFYYNTFYNDTISTPYFEKEINGYTFLFLGSEADDVDSPVISDAQLSWLNEKLAAATADGKPTFVFGHHPHTYYAEPQALLKILTAYENVYFFNGHMHLDSVNVSELADSVYYVNLPCFTELNKKGVPFNATGQGVNVEIYSDKVLLRGRNFYTGEWLTEYVIPIF